MSKGFTVTADNRITPKEFLGLADLQAAVKGLIEPIRLDLGGVEVGAIYVNEEFALGQFDESDVNWFASDLAAACGHPGFLMRPILGPVAIVGPADEEGFEMDVPPVLVALVNLIAAEAGATWEWEAA